MSLMHKNEKKNNARQSHHENEAAKPLSREDLMKRYKDSPFLMARQVFGNGNGRLSAEVRDEVICRNEARKKIEFAVVSRKKMKLLEFISCVKVIKDEMKGKHFKLTIDKLCLLVTYKKTKEDGAIPSEGKATLLTWWNETKHRLSPRCSPNNSNNEEEEEVEEEERNSIVFEEMGTTGLVFGHDDSDNECEE
jgi:hypothetical protein